MSDIQFSFSWVSVQQAFLTALQTVSECQEGWGRSYTPQLWSVCVRGRGASMCGAVSGANQGQFFDVMVSDLEFSFFWFLVLYV